MNQVTHKQHYVWREYLKPWCTLKGDAYFIWWNNGKITRNTDVYDILREKDFYEFKHLNELEMNILENRIVTLNEYEQFKQGNEDMLNQIKLLNKAIEINNSEKTRNALIQLGEDFQSNVEKAGLKYLKFIKDDNLSFYNFSDDNSITEFYEFLIMQYLRTKYMRNKIISSINSTLEKNFRSKIDAGKIANYTPMFLILAMVYSMCINQFDLTVLKSTNCKFIVSDQPIYNIAEDDGVNFDLFYPIAPDKAIYLKKGKGSSSIKRISDNEVNQYNFMTYKHKDVFIMSDEESYVKL